ncbi:Protein ESMERALDA 1 [Camellia lanceoleosa]|uniref:Protein ESMERALDA 1 n=2 Tax=Camellia lanceoleosa TaxID=1840588 RepID=A0ACC0FIV4_9ERIC|nr:Protein ESMERALDA 1 [Camellia lanceoleosa]KAI7989896.1 Protein ESMERALDA 1 [Camellia lanceoleosa]
MAHNRLPGSGHNSSLPQQSPLLSPNRLRHSDSRSKQGRFNFFGNQPPQTLAHRLAWSLLSVLLRRQSVVLLPSFFYGMSISLCYTDLDFLVYYYNARAT